MAKTEEKQEPLLTQKQREIFSQAFHLGYYEWPRKITISKLSTTLRISKTVLLSHLRKAEHKILKNYIL